MQTPLQITIRDLDPSEALAQHVRQRAARLDRFCPTLTACRVTIEKPHRHKKHGHHYRVRIDLSVPGTELVLGRDPDACTEHEDAHAAVDAAFDDAQRVLADHTRRQRSIRRSRARRFAPPAPSPELESA